MSTTPLQAAFAAFQVAYLKVAVLEARYEFWINLDRQRAAEYQQALNEYLSSKSMLLAAQSARLN